MKYSEKIIFINREWYYRIYRRLRIFATTNLFLFTYHLIIILVVHKLEEFTGNWLSVFKDSATIKKSLDIDFGAFFCLTDDLVPAVSKT